MPSPAQSGEPARIMLVDDHPIVRHGLARLLNGSAGLTVCKEVGTLAEALGSVEDARPDIIVVDLSLGDDSGLELIKDVRMRDPHMPILVLSMHDETFYADRAIRAGATGYIMKHEDPEKIIEAVRVVLSGRVYLSEEMSSLLLGRYVGRKQPEASSPVELLSNRELQVFQLIGKGLSSRQIADKLRLSIKTVESHRERIKAKLNLPGGAALVQFAIRWEMEGR